MTKSAIVQARMEPDLKRKADSILERLGINATTAITLFYSQIVRHGGIPLELKIPNAETIEAMQEVRDPSFLKNARRFKSVDELFTDLES